MINFDQPVTGEFRVNGTLVTTTFNRLEQTDKADEYRLLWVLDNCGQEQVTSNGTATITAEQLAALIASQPEPTPPQE
jgi:hypothetical protein